MKFDVDKIKNFMYGLMVIIGLIGGMYGSFKPETDARASHQALAPIIDQASAVLQKQNERLIRLEAKDEVYQQIFVGVFVDIADKEVLLQAATAKLSSDDDSEDTVPDETPDSGPNKRAWERKAPMQQRQRVYWEEK